MTTISDRKLEANRLNAQKSTGPRTPEGKFRTRLNSLRHGLTGQTVLLPEEDRQVCEAPCAAFLEDFPPKAPSKPNLPRL